MINPITTGTHHGNEIDEDEQNREARSRRSFEQTHECHKKTSAKARGLSRSSYPAAEENEEMICECKPLCAGDYVIKRIAEPMAAGISGASVPIIRDRGIPDVAEQRLPAMRYFATEAEDCLEGARIGTAPSSL
ncbi:hypothetical protein [Burkholderia sp. lig30]|jgi:hypothetical protein|uniref:hypothetical protein n=1 Tax=Burkholderia sp. lig30 TaxID=1192124 RepID=UPI00128EBB06|nr:hypothetical protein [Burkholderia sp. lig30]